MTALQALVQAADYLRDHPWRAAKLSLFLGLVAGFGGPLVGIHDGPLVTLTTFMAGFPWAMRVGSRPDARREREEARQAHERALDERRAKYDREHGIDTPLW